MYSVCHGLFLPYVCKVYLESRILSLWLYVVVFVNVAFMCQCHLCTVCSVSLKVVESFGILLLVLENGVCSVL